MKKAPRRRDTDPIRRRNREGRRRYCTARWSRVRRLVIARDRGLCQECLRNGLVEPGRDVDHIERAEDKPELFWQLDNLQLLCVECHSRKTQQGG